MSCFGKDLETCLRGRNILFPQSWSQLPSKVAILIWWAFLLYWAGLLPAVLGPNFLSKGVETGPTATQFGPACAQRLSPSPRKEAAKWAYPLFLLQKKLFSSFCCRIDFFVFSIASFYRRIDVSAVEGIFLQFLPQDWIFCCVAKLSII